MPLQTAAVDSNVRLWSNIEQLILSKIIQLCWKASPICLGNLACFCHPRLPEPHFGKMMWMSWVIVVPSFWKRVLEINACNLRQFIRLPSKLNRKAGSRSAEESLLMLMFMMLCSAVNTLIGVDRFPEKPRYDQSPTYPLLICRLEPDSKLGDECSLIVVYVW